MSAGERRTSTANTIFRDPAWRTKDRDGALRVSPDDARGLGVTDGDRVRVTTRRGSAEATGTERAIALAEMAKVPVYMVHLSAQRALERVMEARDRGLPAYAETCPQYLFCSEDDLRGKPGDEWQGAGYVCTPPLRPAHHHEHLWRGLRNYDLQTVATDHCPFCMKDQKELGRGNFAKIPNGMPGVETRLYLLWEGVRAGKISMNRFVEITATAPAKIFGMYPHKGTVAVGAHADLVVWDGDKEHTLSQKTLHMRIDYLIRDADSGEKITRLTWLASSLITLLRPTSLPVPAVVGMATTGAVAAVILGTPPRMAA